MSDSPIMPATIATALVAAQREAKGVAKDAENTWHNYRYASAEGIIIEARAALGAAGLACVCEGWSIAAGDPLDHVLVQYLIVHEGGECWRALPVPTAVVPEKGRPQDKAEATALTYSLGYFLRGLLLLPRVEAGTDADQRDDSAHVPPTRDREGKAGNGATLAEKVRRMVRDIAAIDRAAGVDAEKRAEEVLQRLDATDEEIRTIGGVLLGELRELETAAQPAADAETPR